MSKKRKSENESMVSSKDEIKSVKCFPSEFYVAIQNKLQDTYKDHSVGFKVLGVYEDADDARWTIAQKQKRIFEKWALKNENHIDLNIAEKDKDGKWTLKEGFERNLELFRFSMWLDINRGEYVTKKYFFEIRKMSEFVEKGKQPTPLPKMKEEFKSVSDHPQYVDIDFSDEMEKKKEEETRSKEKTKTTKQSKSEFQKTASTTTTTTKQQNNNSDTINDNAETKFIWITSVIYQNDDHRPECTTSETIGVFNKKSKAIKAILEKKREILLEMLDDDDLLQYDFVEEKDGTICCKEGWSKMTSFANAWDEINQGDLIDERYTFNIEKFGTAGKKGQLWVPHDT